MPTSCKDIDAQIVDWLYDELDSSARASFRTHLDSCESCASQLASLSFVREAMGELPRLEPPQTVSNIVLHEAGKRAAGAAGRERGGLWTWLAGLFQPVLAHPAAAALASLVLIATVGGTMYLRKGGGQLAEPVIVRGHDGDGDNSGAATPARPVDMPSATAAESTISTGSPGSTGSPSAAPAAADPTTWNQGAQNAEPVAQGDSYRADMVGEEQQRSLLDSEQPTSAQYYKALEKTSSKPKDKSVGTLGRGQTLDERFAGDTVGNAISGGALFNDSAADDSTDRDSDSTGEAEDRAQWATPPAQEPAKESTEESAEESAKGMVDQTTRATRRQTKQKAPMPDGLSQSVSVADHPVEAGGLAGGLPGSDMNASGTRNRGPVSTQMTTTNAPPPPVAPAPAHTMSEGRAATAKKSSMPAGKSRSKSAGKSDTRSVSGWAEAQYSRLASAVQAKRCDDAARIANDILERDRKYYDSNLRNTKLLSPCQKYVAAESRRRASRSKKKAKRAAPAKADAAKATEAPAE